MGKYRMADGTVVDTDNASASWPERKEFDGHNQVSVHTGDQWSHQHLYRSRKARYYIEHWSDWQGSRAHVEWVSPEEATRWLILNGNKLPEDLAALADEITE